MLSIASMAGGQGNYYAQLAREDYYLIGGEPPGVWMGRGAQALGLVGTINRKVFLELFDGFQNSKALVQGAGGKRHRPGWDLTFSAPKSVSVAWSQAEEEIAQEIQASHFSAVEKAVGYLENQAIWTRRGKSGRDHERGGAVVATFEHGTSRAQEPQLHTHALFLNVALRNDGTTGTLETRALYLHKMAGGAIYRAELAHQLQRRLGLSIVRQRSWFELEGVSAKLIDRFSSRRKEIVSILRQRNLTSSRAAEIAALDSREAKEHAARRVLKTQWREEGESLGWGLAELQGITRGRQLPQNFNGEIERAMTECLENLMTSQSSFAKRDFTRALAESAQTIGCGSDVVLSTVEEHILTSSELVRLGTRHREPIYTTKAMLALERDLLQRAGKSREESWERVGEAAVTWAFDSRPTIKDEQQAAVRHITQETGGIALINGMAGTGKTFMLDATRSALELSGYNVIGAALSGKAARGLQEETRIECSTIASLLRKLGRETHPLSRKTVLIVDEAGMVGTRQLHQLLVAVQDAHAKLVLVGDQRQLQPIEAGGPFAALNLLLGSAMLQDIVRQREAWQRGAVKDLAVGNAGRALTEYARRGLVWVADRHEDAVADLLEAWRGAGIAQPQDNLILTGTNLDACVVNRYAQELRVSAGYVRHGNGVDFGDERICEGDRVLFTRNAHHLGVANGSLGTVSEISTLGTVRISLDGGGERRFSRDSYNHLRLGYAFTTHRSQGMTAENVFILTNESMQYREISYVQASRVRGEARFFTTQSEAGEDLSQLSRTMARSRQKELALLVPRPFERSNSPRNVAQNLNVLEHHFAP